MELPGQTFEIASKRHFTYASEWLLIACRKPTFGLSYKLHLFLLSQQYVGFWIY